MPVSLPESGRLRLRWAACIGRTGAGIVRACRGWFREVAAGDAGVTAIEYALIGSLIAVAIAAGVGALGVELGALYLRVCNAVVGALGGGSC